MCFIGELSYLDRKEVYDTVHPNAVKNQVAIKQLHHYPPPQELACYNKEVVLPTKENSFSRRFKTDFILK